MSTSSGANGAAGGEQSGPELSSDSLREPIKGSYDVEDDERNHMVSSEFLMIPLWDRSRMSSLAIKV